MSEAGDISLPELLEATWKQRPDALAVLGKEGQLTYAQLVEQARVLGMALAAETARPVVALFLPMCTGFPSAFFGAHYAGKTALPLNLLLPPEELAYILKDSGADLVLTLKSLQPRLEKLPANVRALEDLRPPARARAVAPPSPGDVCTLLYTSGTTGRPKGVELTHRNLASNTLACIEVIGFRPAYRMLACLPTFHTFAITATLLAPLAAGGSLYTLPRFQPQAALQAASGARCNVLAMVPSMYRLLTRRQQRKPVPMEHLKIAIAGGEPLAEDTARDFEATFGVPLLEGYGLTESSPVICFNTLARHRPHTVGRPIPGVEVKIADPRTSAARPTGEIGEIWTRGPHVMKGYHNRPQESAEALTPDGWLRTGDMGRVDEDGYLAITGRLREMIKVGGEMVFPAEVENALLEHPAVFEAGVIGEKDERRGETVRAFVALAEGQQTTAEPLLAHCRERLAPYKVPRSIEIRAELPKGPTGKVLRRLLK